MASQSPRSSGRGGGGGRRRKGPLPSMKQSITNRHGASMYSDINYYDDHDYYHPYDTTATATAAINDDSQPQIISASAPSYHHNEEEQRGSSSSGDNHYLHNKHAVASSACPAVLPRSKHSQQHRRHNNSNYNDNSKSGKHYIKYHFNEYASSSTSSYGEDDNQPQEDSSWMKAPLKIDISLNHASSSGSHPPPPKRGSSTPVRSKSPLRVSGSVANKHIGTPTRSLNKKINRTPKHPAHRTSSRSPAPRQYKRTASPFRSNTEDSLQTIEPSPRQRLFQQQQQQAHHSHSTPTFGEPLVSASPRVGFGSSLSAMKTGVREKLFGDSPTQRMTQDDIPTSITPRTLLKWTVASSNSGAWLLTVNTNRKQSGANEQDGSSSSNSVQAFLFNSKEEAEVAGNAYAPPAMVPPIMSPRCFVCEGSFAVLRRPKHCRNCGVCICTNCSSTWPSKMVPDTYNYKNESTVRVCQTCDWLNKSFRIAITDGKFDEAMALYESTNINVRCPFANIKGEIMYPVHSAVLSNNLEMVQWLCDTLKCPLHVPTSKHGRSDEPLTTSKGKSCLDIAMRKQDVSMIRYLVVEKSMSIYAIKNVKALQRVLLTSLHAISGEQTISSNGLVTNSRRSHNEIETNHEDSFEATDDDIDVVPPVVSSSGSDSSGENDCKICFERPINCVLTPCGHQVCCTDCFSQMSNQLCPVCSYSCSYIRTFRP